MTTPPLPADNDLSHQLQRLLQSIEAAGRAVLPRTHEALLRSIVEAAARIFGAAAASIALADEHDQVLQFVVSCGAGQDQVVGMRIPLDQGIAGYVAMTGQPMAISDVQQDPRFAEEFARSTGYVPRSILATPLISDDRVIGVMEVLDKIGDSSFGLQDMELLGMFARQAALAIHQSQQVEHVSEALILGLERLATSDRSAEATELVGALRRAHTDLDDPAGILALADMFSRVSALGEAERRAGLEMMAVLARYAQSRLRL
jgi:GAF domain-containing protein